MSLQTAEHYKAVRQRLMQGPPKKLKPPALPPPARYPAMSPEVVQCQRESAFNEMYDARAPLNVSIKQILNATARYYRIPADDITSDRRTPSIILPRHVTMYLARILTTHSTPVIGQHTGNRDHSTVVRAVEGIRARVTKEEPQLIEDIAIIKRSLGVAA